MSANLSHPVIRYVLILEEVLCAIVVMDIDGMELYV